MLLSKSAVITQLKAKSGFTFKQLIIEDIGDYAVEDASWNYRDGILHIPYVHPLVKNVPFAISDEVLCNVFFQKLFGLTFPMVVVDTEPKGRNFQLSFASCFFFCMLIQNSYQAIGENKTKVTTEYNVGLPRILAWVFPLIAFSLRKNYAALMSTDIPMRNRRGNLRAEGFRFASDDQPSYVAAGEIGRDNVIPPPLPSAAVAPVALGTMRVDAILANPQVLQAMGDDKAQGFLARASDDQKKILVFPRTCKHEGARLQDGRCDAEKIICPWHGKKVAPLAVLGKEGDQTTVSHPFYPAQRLRLRTSGGVLSVTTEPAPTAKVDFTGDHAIL